MNLYRTLMLSGLLLSQIVTTAAIRPAYPVNLQGGCSLGEAREYSESTIPLANRANEYIQVKCNSGAYILMQSVYNETDTEASTDNSIMGFDSTNTLNYYEKRSAADLNQAYLSIVCQIISSLQDDQAQSFYQIRQCPHT